MAYYYLVSQLPNISAAESKTALPLNAEGFRELASRFISDEEKVVLENLSLVPPMELTSTGSAFLDTFIVGDVVAANLFTISFLFTYPVLIAFT